MGRGVDTWSNQTLLNNTAKELQKAVRMEAADDNGFAACVSCGKVKHYKELNGGHYIQRKHKVSVLDERNIHPQCVHCNKHLHGNLAGYTVYMIARYGHEVVEELRLSQFKTRKFDRDELISMRKVYMARIKVQEQRLGE